MRQSSPTELTPAVQDMPRTVWACLPWMWSHILFRGTTPKRQSLRWQSLLILLILPGAVLYPCLTFHLFEPDEGRYAEIPREMLVYGDWIVPHLHGEPYLDKPPLMYWLVMVSYSIFGIHDWSARLIPALAVHGSILLVYLLGRRRLGERAAFCGALVLALAPGFEGMARLLVLDGVLTFFVTLALFTIFEAVQCERLVWRWWLVAAVACALGVLTKGPIILVLVLVPLWLNRRLTSAPLQIPWTARLVFAAIVAVLALPWYIAICLRLPDFAEHFLWTHNVMRFVQPFDHIQPVWYYLPILAVCLLPTSLLLPFFLRFLFSNRPHVAGKRSPELGYFLLAGLWCVLFFSLSGSKLPTYVLPAFPPLALAFGVFIASTRWRTSALTLTAAATMYGMMLVGNHWLVPRYAEFRSPMRQPLRVAEYCGDENVPVICYPRTVDSVAFYLGRDDFRSFRSKHTPQFLHYLQRHERAVILFSHRHSHDHIKNVLPPTLMMTGRTPLGLCDMAVVECKRQRQPRQKSLSLFSKSQ